MNSVKSRNNDRQPHWEHYEDMKRNWNLYSVGTLADRKFWWSKFMGGWVSATEIHANAQFNEFLQEEVMLAADMQRIYFRSPIKSILKVKDVNC